MYPSVGDTKYLLEPFHKDVQSYVLVAEGGTCMSYFPFVLHTSCSMDMANFPFDVQTCNITAGSWTYDSKQLKLSIMDPPIAWWGKFAVDGEWKITGTKATISEEPYGIFFKDNWHTVHFDELTFSITLVRNPSFYINNIVVPTAMLGVVAIFSFLLPPGSGERISLCLTTLLAIAVYAMVVADNVPESARDVPLISKFFFKDIATERISEQFNSIKDILSRVIVHITCDIIFKLSYWLFQNVLSFNAVLFHLGFAFRDKTKIVNKCF